MGTELSEHIYGRVRNARANIDEIRKWTDYLYADGAMVGVEITEISGGVTQSVELKYFVTDHLGVVEERLSYDAWGKRRYPSGADDTAGSLTSSVMTRGFTGHEMLDDTDLVQMNGRIYDPSLGKFLSPDPFIQDKYLGASLIRYSYVWNNEEALQLNIYNLGRCGCHAHKPKHTEQYTIHR